MRISVKGGVRSKISRSYFHLSEIYQCIYHNAECFEDNTVVTDRALQYNFIILFKERSIEPIEIRFSKRVLNELKKNLMELKRESMADNTTGPDLHLFIIK